MSFSELCPYCDEYIELEENDDHYENYQEYQCPSCEKYFEVLAEPTVKYSIRGKSPCLNGEEHEWKKRVGYPSRTCKTCKNFYRHDNSLSRGCLKGYSTHIMYGIPCVCADYGCIRHEPKEQ